jgi:hypothetical protein
MTYPAIRPGLLQSSSAISRNPLLARMCPAQGISDGYPALCPAVDPLLSTKGSMPFLVCPTTGVWEAHARTGGSVYLQEVHRGGSASGWDPNRDTGGTCL